MPSDEMREAAGQFEDGREMLQEALAKQAQPVIDRIIGQQREAIPEMPFYDCHKRVQALEIAVVICESKEARDWITLRFTDARFPPRSWGSEASIFKGGIPKAGDFFIVYKDGYTSLSPRKAFLEGYLRVAHPGPISRLEQEGQQVFVGIDPTISKEDAIESMMEDGYARRSALDAAVRSSRQFASPAEVLNNAQVFYGFLKGKV